MKIVDFISVGTVEIETAWIVFDVLLKILTNYCLPFVVSTIILY